MMVTAGLATVGLSGCLSAGPDGLHIPGRASAATTVATTAPPTTVPATTTTVYQPEKFHRLYAAKATQGSSNYLIELELSDPYPAPDLPDLSRCKGVKPSQMRVVQFQLSFHNESNAVLRVSNSIGEAGNGTLFLTHYVNGTTCDRQLLPDSTQLKPQESVAIDGHILLLDGGALTAPGADTAKQPKFSLRHNGVQLAFTGPGLEESAPAPQRRSIQVVNPAAPAKP